jgi:hypothetical protein
MFIATVAHIKLAALVAESSASAVGRRVGCTPNTVRLLAGGAAAPTVKTVKKLLAVGIEAQDWFTEAPRLYGHEPTPSVRTSDESAEVQR